MKQVVTKTVSRHRASSPKRRLGQRVDVIGRPALKRCNHWPNTFAHTRKDDRYYEIVEDTIMPDFDYRYFAVRDDKGAVCAVQPFFLLDQDLLAGASPALRSAAGIVRKLWPRFLTMRMLMLGCAAGESHLDRRHDDGAADAALIARTITQHAKALRARLIVLKEFPADYRAHLEAFRAHGFARIPSLPMAQLDLNYADFDDYMQRGISARMRSELRRKFRAAEAGTPITMTVVRDVSNIIDDIYPLYLQVYERSDRHFEKLSKSYFCALGQRMPDKVRFFIWRSEGRAIAFSLTMVHEDHICNEYLGLDYTVALERHLYFMAFRDTVSWAIGNGYKRCLTTGLGYKPKLHLGFDLYPLDLYVRHTSDLLNRLFSLILPLIEPTRSEPILKRFRNYDALRAGTASASSCCPAAASPGDRAPNTRDNNARRGSHVSGSVVKNSG